MLRAVNHTKKQIICCPFVCGTSYLHLHVLRNEDYEHYRGNWDIPEDYTIYKIVRDPIQRWHSWYNKFIIENSIKPEDNTALVYINAAINKKNIKSWFDNFSCAMHYDGHTGLQKYLHYSDKRFNSLNEKFIASSHLQNFLGNSNKNYIDRIYNYKSRSEIDKYLYNLYQQDIDWIQGIEIIK